MGSDLGAPKLIFQREAPAIRPVFGVASNVAHLFGVTERGPVGVATLCTGWDSYKKVFGRYLADHDLAVQLYRACRGKGLKRFYVTRVVHYSDPSDITTKMSDAATTTHKTATSAATGGTVLGSAIGPFDLEPGDTLHVVTDVANATATFDATPAALECTDDEPWDFTGGKTLVVEIDGVEQTITFLESEFETPSAATAAEVAAVINSKMLHGSAAVTSTDLVTIYSDKRGKGSTVEVTGGTANVLMVFPAGPVTGTGSQNLLDIDAVTVAEVKAVVEAVGALTASVLVTNDGGKARFTRKTTTGPGSTIQIHSDSTADDELGLDNAVHAGYAGTALDTLQVDAISDGTWANAATGGLSSEAVEATDGSDSKFDLVIYENGVEAERWRNITIGAACASLASYCQTAINGKSELIVVTDKLAAAPSPYNLPELDVEKDLAGGDDGLVSLADADYLDRGGMKARDLVTEPVLIQYSPDITAPASVISMLDYGNTPGQRMYTIIDPTEDTKYDDLVTAYKGAGLIEYSELADVIWPWVKVTNPDPAVYGYVDTIEVGPGGGTLAAIISQDAKRGGVYEAPRGTEIGHMTDVVGVADENVYDPGVRDYLYSNRINFIHKSKSGKFYADGTKTLMSTGSFPTVGESRGVLFIEHSLDTALEWIKNRNMTVRFYDRVYDQTYLFLLQQMNDDAFATTDPSTAFYISMSLTEINPPSERAKHKLNVKVGLATAEPCDYGFFTITKDVRALEEEVLRG